MKAAASERGANAQMVHYGRAEMTRRAKLVVMPRLQIGLIDLDTAVTKKKPAVDELIDECEAREIAVPRTRSVSPTRSTSYLSRTSSWQNFNVLNPRDSGLHKCLQRFSKSTNQSVAYWGSTKMLWVAARGNCGKLEKWTAGKSTAWKLPDPAQTPQPSSW